MKLSNLSILLIIGWAAICKTDEAHDCKPPNEASVDDVYQLIPLPNDTMACVNIAEYYANKQASALHLDIDPINFLDDSEIVPQMAPIPGLGPLFQPGTPFYGIWMDQMMGKGIKFFVYVPGKEEPLVLKALEDMDVSFLQETKQMVLMIHGWTANHDSDVIKQLAKAYQQEKYPAVLVGVDWSSMSRRSYGDSRGQVYGVGEVVGDQIKKLFNKVRVYIRMGCVGHSLGAHVCGSIGKATNQLDFLIGLDPASPLFFEESKDLLRQSDARYVEVIHTCTMSLGYEKPMGHADIYPFTGVAQPGCIKPSCSHSKSIAYFIDAVRNKGLDIVPCDSVKSVKTNRCQGQQPTKISGTTLIKKSGIFTNVYSDKDKSWLGSITGKFNSFKDSISNMRKVEL